MKASLLPCLRKPAVLAPAAGPSLDLCLERGRNIALFGQPLRTHPQECQKLSEIDQAFGLSHLLIAQIGAGVLLIEKPVKPLLNRSGQPALLQVVGEFDFDS